MLLFSTAVAAKGLLPDSQPSLEELAYRYGTDKSHDDHKYVDVYAAVFDAYRDQVANLTEIGVASGQSIQMWHDYFRNARIWGFDKTISDPVHRHFRHQRRVVLQTRNAYKGPSVNVAPESMDIVIDDAIHRQNYMELLLSKWWPTVRPGGFYVIEDIECTSPTPGSAEVQVMMKETPLMAQTKEILEGNMAFFVDPLFGHRNFTAWNATTVWGTPMTHSRRRHNSYMAFIRKRTAGRPALPWQQNFVENHATHTLTNAMTTEWMKRNPPPQAQREVYEK